VVGTWKVLRSVLRVLALAEPRVVSVPRRHRGLATKRLTTATTPTTAVQNHDGRSRCNGANVRPPYLLATMSLAFAQRCCPCLKLTLLHALCPHLDADGRVGSNQETYTFKNLRFNLWSVPLPRSVGRTCGCHDIRPRLRC
jgi:hypothetical protein